MDSVLTLVSFFREYFARLFLDDARPRTFEAYEETLAHWQQITGNPTLPFGGAFRFCRRKLAWKNTFESSIRAVLFQIPGGKEFHHALCHGRLEGGSEDNRNRAGVARGKSGVGAVAGGRMHADGRSELTQREREGKALTDRLQAVATALEVQRALASPALHEQERTLVKASPKKMKDFGYRPVTVQFLGGLEVELMARYWCRSQARANKGKGSYFGLVLLGVCDRTTPALASEVAQLAAALSSFDDAQARLRQMGITMSVRRIANVAYRFAQRARSRQELDGMGIEGSLAGKRVVISTDGGRLRVRKNKRGQKTKKGRSRYRTDWREPKLLVIYVVDEKGRLDQELRR